jgi:hypothetical protein
MGVEEQFIIAPMLQIVECLAWMPVAGAQLQQSVILRAESIEPHFVGLVNEADNPGQDTMQPDYRAALQPYLGEAGVVNPTTDCADAFISPGGGGFNHMHFEFLQAATLCQAISQAFDFGTLVPEPPSLGRDDESCTYGEEQRGLRLGIHRAIDSGFLPIARTPVGPLHRFRCFIRVLGHACTLAGGKSGI